MEVAVASLQVATFQSANSPLHAAQTLIFSSLSRVLSLWTSLNAVLTGDAVDAARAEAVKWREPTERALRELILNSAIAQRPGSLTKAHQLLLRDLWRALYFLGDSRNMLALAGELQDFCSNSTKGPDSQHCAVLASLTGMTLARGKALSGHLVSTITLAEQAMDSRSRSALRAVAAIASSSVAPPISGSTSVRIAYIEATVHGYMNANLSVKVSHWSALVKAVLLKALTLKSRAVRFAALWGIEQLVRGTHAVPSDVRDKIVPALLFIVTKDDDEQVQVRAGSTLGASLLCFCSNPTGTLNPAQPTVTTFDNIPKMAKFNELIDAVVYAHTQLGGAISVSESLLNCLVSLFEARSDWQSASESDANTAQFAIESLLRLSAACDNDTDLNRIHEAMRKIIGSRLCERLQLLMCGQLLGFVGTSTNANSKRLALKSVQCFVGTLDEASSYKDIVPPILTILLNSTEGNSSHNAVYLEAAACIRAYLLVTPDAKSFGRIAAALLSPLENERDSARIIGPVLGLCQAIYAAASVNKASSLPITQLFALGRAMAFRVLDNEVAFSREGWRLLRALLCLGPSVWGIHLNQLFTLWSETFNCKHRAVKIEALAALNCLLRNCDQEDQLLLGRASETLMSADALLDVSTHGFDEMKRFHAALLETCAFKSLQLGHSKLDSNLVSIAISYLCDSTRTTLADGFAGGLLHPRDSVLLTSTAKITSHEPLSFLEQRDAVEHCCELHALIGRRSQSRPRLGSRLADASVGAPVEDLNISNEISDARCIPHGETAKQRVVDAAVCFLATHFVRMLSSTSASDEERIAFVTMLLIEPIEPPASSAPLKPASTSASSVMSQLLKKATSNGMAPSTPSQREPLARTMNVCSTILAFMLMLKIHPIHFLPEAHQQLPWCVQLSDYLFASLADDSVIVRRCAAEAIVSMMQSKLLPASVSASDWIADALTSPVHGENVVCGALLLFSLMRRARIDLLPQDNLIFDKCANVTSPSVRIASLHAWLSVLSLPWVFDPSVHVEPTLSLIHAHSLLGDVDQRDELERLRPDETADSMNLILVKSCIAVVTGLGPELALSQEFMTTIVDFWHHFARLPAKPSMTSQCIKLAEGLAMFHPSPPHLIRKYARHHLVSSPRLFAIALSSCMRFAERDSAFDIRKDVFTACERAGRLVQPCEASWLSSEALRREAWARGDDDQHQVCNAAGPILSQSKKRVMFYPPRSSELGCSATCELIRNNLRRSNVDEFMDDWFSVLKDIVAGKGGSQSSRASVAPAENGEEDINAVINLHDNEELRDSTNIREWRWQMSALGIECISVLVANKPRQNPQQLEALIACASQAAMAMSAGGEASLPSLQSRGLMALNQIVKCFANEPDPAVANVSVLRQYDAQLNAVLRKGLSTSATPELATKAIALSTSLLLHSVSVSVNKLAGRFVDDLAERFYDASRIEADKKPLESGRATDEDDDFATILAQHQDVDYRDKEEGGGFAESTLIETAESDQDDADATSVALSECCALAKLFLFTDSRFTEVVVGADNTGTFHSESQNAIRAFIHRPNILSKLSAMWTSVVRDYVVLQRISSASLLPRRHPQALYKGGSTPQDVSALLPAYSKAWSICALARATLSSVGESDHSLLFWQCINCCIKCDSDDSSLVLLSVRTLETLFANENVKIPTDYIEFATSTLARRALRASTRGHSNATVVLLSAISIILSRKLSHSGLALDAIIMSIHMARNVESAGAGVKALIAWSENNELRPEAGLFLVCKAAEKGASAADLSRGLKMFHRDEFFRAWIVQLIQSRSIEGLRLVASWDSPDPSFVLHDAVALSVMRETLKRNMGFLLSDSSLIISSKLWFGTVLCEDETLRDAIVHKVSPETSSSAAMTTLEVLGFLLPHCVRVEGTWWEKSLCTLAETFSARASGVKFSKEESSVWGAWFASCARASPESFKRSMAAVASSTVRAAVQDAVRASLSASSTQ